MKKIFIVLVALTVLLAGCANESDPNRLDRPFVGGNAAVNLYLQNGMPPPAVLDSGQESFSIGVVLENIGEADIGPGTDNPFFQVRLEGLLPSNYGLSDGDLLQTPSTALPGTRKNFDGTVLPGQLVNVIFQSLSFQPSLPGPEGASFRVVACYDYANRARATLCMKDDILENVQDSTLCTLTGPKPVSNSGGPIQVLGATQNPLAANEILVTLEIGHVGTGEFYGRSPEESCNPRATNMNKYNVDLTITSDNPNAEIVCQRLNGGSSGSLRLQQGAPQLLTCTVSGGDTAARIYQQSLDVEIQYRYGEFIEDRFNIRALPR